VRIGRGLFLMRSLMDRVERYEADERNVVRLTLRRS
jgi:anti-sigma regulatory factor (Ser/Thr protein kinase)